MEIEDKYSQSPYYTRALYLTATILKSRVKRKRLRNVIKRHLRKDWRLLCPSLCGQVDENISRWFNKEKDYPIKTYPRFLIAF
jgi:hypothetical protein